jgi:hypothetical protein
MEQRHANVSAPAPLAPGESSKQFPEPDSDFYQLESADAFA